MEHESEAAVSLETPIPLFAATGMAASAVTQGEHATWMERAPHKRLMLFAGRSNMALGEAIAERLGIKLGDVTLKTFTNGEVYVRYEESIRGADVFIVQSCVSPTNDALVELLVMVQAAALASAKRVTAVMPWYPYSRQDKKGMPREPITARLVADILQAAGVDRVLTMDLHAGQVQGFFHKPVDHMTAVPILAEHFTMLLDLEHDEVVVVSADAGRVKLATKFAEMLGADLALITKERPEHQEAQATNVIGRVRGKSLHPPRRHDRHRGHALRRRPGAARPRRDARLRMRDPPGVLGTRARAARVERVREGGRDRHDPDRPDDPARERPGAVGGPDPG